MPIGDLLQSVMMSIFGTTFAVSIFLFIYFRDSHRWRYLEQAYGRPWRRSTHVRHLQSAITYGKGVASNAYKGIVSIGVHDDGVAMRILPPFSLFMRPLFIPFKDIKGWEQFWYLDTTSYELEFEKAPAVKMVMPASQVRWLMESAKQDIKIVEDPSPNNARPNIWYTIILAHGILGVAMLLIFLLAWLGKAL